MRLPRSRLFERLQDAQLAQAAASLSFTTLLSLVPLLAVGFALFTLVPALRPFRRTLEGLWLPHLLPADLAQPVLRYLGRFADNAHGLSWSGAALLLVAALAMMFTVETALNRIWQVRQGRPWRKRLALYLPLLAAGPLVLGWSLWATSRALALSQGLMSPWPPAVEVLWTLGPAALNLAMLFLLFYLVPHAPVRWHEALLGGLLGAAGLEAGKQAFATYVLALPTYRTLYGSFAVFPVFLLWIYYSWAVTLAAAVVTAHLGSLRAARGRGIGRAARPGRTRA
ncbi:YihY family inner membrane protein [Caldimonas manganoxidans]|uniref:YihY family inner membrane protein n=1 Tax=Caldimonas manganoxidans TaxID=196015 RepID=UPI0003644831|nr:YihY family inner membrane protein [Caldimonas manganoxidans]